MQLCSQRSKSASNSFSIIWVLFRIVCSFFGHKFQHICDIAPTKLRKKSSSSTFSFMFCSFLELRNLRATFRWKFNYCTMFIPSNSFGGYFFFSPFISYFIVNDTYDTHKHTHMKWNENKILFAKPFIFLHSFYTFLIFLSYGIPFTWNFSENYIESYNFLSMKKHGFLFLIRILAEVLYIFLWKFSPFFAIALDYNNVVGSFPIFPCLIPVVLFYMLVHGTLLKPL